MRSSRGRGLTGGGSEHGRPHAAGPGSGRSLLGDGVHVAVRRKSHRPGTAAARPPIDQGRGHRPGSGGYRPVYTSTAGGQLGQAFRSMSDATALQRSILQRRPGAGLCSSDGHGGEPLLGLPHLRRRQHHAPHTVHAADVDLMSLGHQHPHMDDVPGAHGPGRLYSGPDGKAAAGPAGPCQWATCRFAGVVPPDRPTRVSMAAPLLLLSSGPAGPGPGTPSAIWHCPG